MSLRSVEPCVWCGNDVMLPGSSWRTTDDGQVACSDKCETEWSTASSPASVHALLARVAELEALAQPATGGDECDGSCQIALASRQVGPDGLVPGNAKECAEMWEREASRLRSEVSYLKSIVEVRGDEYRRGVEDAARVAGGCGGCDECGGGLEVERAIRALSPPPEPCGHTRQRVTMLRDRVCMDCGATLSPPPDTERSLPLMREAAASVALDRDQTHYVGDSCPGGHADTERCERCGGTGRFLADYPVTHHEECPACGGSGVRSASRDPGSPPG